MSSVKRSAIARFPTRGIGPSGVVTHLSSNSRMGYFLFLWSNESINTINVANATANISASNTDIGTTPFHTGVSRPPLSYLFYCSFIVPYVRSCFFVVSNFLLGYLFSRQRSCESSLRHQKLGNIVLSRTPFPPNILCSAGS